MKFNKKIMAILLVLFFSILVMNNAFAEEAPAMPEVDSGTVSGGVDLVYANPFTETTGELTYQIPNDSKEITSATVVVNVYSGSGSPSYGLWSNVTLSTSNETNETKNLGYEELWFDQVLTNDPAVYVINNHTTKQYSDYQMVYNVTQDLNNLKPGDSVTIRVANTAMDGLSFDGRIKLISLIVAYNDFDDDKIAYFLNIGQSWVKGGNRSNLIYTKDYNGEYDEVLLQTIALASANGQIEFNDNILLDPLAENYGNYCIYEKWNVTSLFELGKDNTLTYTTSPSSTYASFKENIELLTINEKETVNVSITPKAEYVSSGVNYAYAGVNNTLTAKIDNNGKDLNNYSLVLMEGDKVLNTVNGINLVNGSNTIAITDPTIRPITQNTVLGKNNSKINYTFIIKDENGIEVNQSSMLCTLVYNGNLGKDFEYPPMNGTIVRKYNITGDILILNQNVSTYASGAVTNIAVAWDISNVELVEGLLYVSYNWDKTTGSEYPVWNVTFNNNIISPIAMYRDQSNMGSFGSLGYGLFVYNVTSLIQSGKNNLTIAKTNGLTAVYPASLMLLYNDDTANTVKNIYISENADLLSITNNKNLITGSFTKFDIDSDGATNGTLYVCAASAQTGEGNIVINGEEFTNVWNGTSSSFDSIKFDVNNLKDNNTVFFQSTGSTILALHQVLVVEKVKANTTLANTTLTSEDIVKYYKNGTQWVATLTDNKGNPISNATLSFEIGGVIYNKTTSDDGKATLDINLNPGVYNGTVYYKGSDVYNSCGKNVSITVLAVIKPVIVGTDMTIVTKTGNKFTILLKDENNRLLTNQKVNFTICLKGSKVPKTYTLTTDENGIAGLNINLMMGKWSMVISIDEPGLEKTNKTFVLTSIRNEAKFVSNPLNKITNKGDLLKVRLVDQVGVALANQKVTIHVGSAAYTRTTDENGYASLPINLLNNRLYNIFLSFAGTSLYTSCTGGTQIKTAY